VSNPPVVNATSQVHIINQQGGEDSSLDWDNLVRAAEVIIVVLVSGGTIVYVARTNNPVNIKT
jgi:S-adenosylmethionine:diacylglycerol 3-amino-3-carboxypropyl transferase